MATTWSKILDKNIVAQSRGSEGIGLGTTAATAGDDIGFEKQIVTDTVTPRRYETSRLCDINVNHVNEKTLNDDEVGNGCDGQAEGGRRR